jgi:hypothetical protein
MPLHGRDINLGWQIISGVFFFKHAQAGQVARTADYETDRYYRCRAKALLHRCPLLAHMLAAARIHQRVPVS